MITARNYAAQAARDLRAEVETAWWVDHPNEKEQIVAVIRDIEKAQHFALPDGGRLLNDKLRGIDGESIRLPYPAITVEYYVPELVGDGVHVPKRLVIATEINKKTLATVASALSWSATLFADVHDTAILINFAAWVDGKWNPGYCCAIIPDRWGGTTAANAGNYRHLGEPRPGDPAVRMQVLVMHSIQEMFLQQGATLRVIEENAVRDLKDEIAAVMELVEALSCSNVGAEVLEKVDPNTQARRVRAGKTPLYETKILTIKVPGRGSVGTNGTATDRNSPRQHLRRGHIRRLQGKKIWVNSCVVGSVGFVDKSYALAHG